MVEARREIPVDPAAPFLGSRGARQAEAVGSFAVDDAGQQQARTHSPACGHRVAHLGDELELVADVAHGGDSSGEVEGSPFNLLEMGVHVPEAGNDKLAGCIDDNRVRRHCHFSGGSDRIDASIFDEHRAIREGRFARHVDDRAPSDGDGAVRARALGGRGFRERGHPVGGREGDQSRERRRQLGTRGLEVIELGVDADERREPAGLVAPQRLASPDHALDAVSIEGNRSAATLDDVAAARFDLRHTVGQQRKGRRPAVRRPETHQLHLHRGRGIPRHREHRSRDRRVSRQGAIADRRGAVGDRHLDVDGRCSRRLSFDREVDGSQRRIELQSRAQRYRGSSIGEGEGGRQH